MKMNKEGEKWASYLGCIALIIIIVIGFIIYYSPTNRTKRVLKDVAGNHGTKNYTMNHVDGWDNKLKYTYIKSKTLLQFIVTSSGKDGKFGTVDDLKIEKRDYNKSRIVGKYITDKLREVGKGVKDSLLEEASEKDKKDHEGLIKNIGKKVGGSIKELKDGFKEGIDGIKGK